MSTAFTASTINSSNLAITTVGVSEPAPTDAKNLNSGSVQGSCNVAFGISTLNKITTGSNNTAVGQNILTQLKSGSNNTYVGYNNVTSVTTVADESIMNTTAVGHSAGQLSSGSANTYVGVRASSTNNGTGTDGVNRTVIGYANDLNVTASDVIVLGNSSTSSFFGKIPGYVLYYYSENDVYRNYVNVYNINGTPTGVLYTRIKDVPYGVTPVGIPNTYYRSSDAILAGMPSRALISQLTIELRDFANNLSSTRYLYTIMTKLPDRLVTFTPTTYFEFKGPGNFLNGFSSVYWYHTIGTFANQHRSFNIDVTGDIRLEIGGGSGTDRAILLLYLLEGTSLIASQNSAEPAFYNKPENRVIYQWNYQKTEATRTTDTVVNFNPTIKYLLPAGLDYVLVLAVQFQENFGTDDTVRVRLPSPFNLICRMP